MSISTRMTNSVSVISNYNIITITREAEAETPTNRAALVNLPLAIVSPTSERDDCRDVTYHSASRGRTGIHGGFTCGVRNSCQITVEYGILAAPLHALLLRPPPPLFRALGVGAGTPKIPSITKPNSPLHPKRTQKSSRS